MAPSDSEGRGFGDQYDAVSLVVNGNRTVVYKSYEVKVAILQQPAAFSLRLGWSQTAAEMLSFYRPGQSFQLLIGDTAMQSGIIDAVEIPRSKTTELEIRGRDYMARLFNSCIKECVTFNARTYYELTRAVLDKVGYKDKTLLRTNDGNRKLVGRVKFVADPAEANQIVDQTNLNMCQVMPQAQAGKMVFEHIKAKVGQTWYQFLQEQYKLSGLHLWCTGDGNFVLARPSLVQPPVFNILRPVRNDQSTVRTSDILDHRYCDDRTNRHSECFVYGHHGARLCGGQKVKGYAADPEMIADGFDQPLVLHDKKPKSNKEANYLCRRALAEERRMGWHLAYSFAGHRKPSAQSAETYCAFTPDTLVHVNDQELGLEDDYYVENVTYSRKPQTETLIELMRIEDAKFLSENPD